MLYSLIKVVSVHITLSRTYLNTRFELGRHVDLWFKYALSWYPDQETISSGLNEKQGHHRQDIKVQFRLRF